MDAPRITWTEAPPQTWHGTIDLHGTYVLAATIAPERGALRLRFFNPYMLASSSATNPQNLTAVKERAQKLLDDAHAYHHRNGASS